MIQYQYCVLCKVSPTRACHPRDPKPKHSIDLVIVYHMCLYLFFQMAENVIIPLEELDISSISLNNDDDDVV